MAKRQKINIKGKEILVYSQQSEDYISLTDIARFRDAERSDYILQNWMRNRSTIEFMGLWEMFNNPDFNSIECMCLACQNLEYIKIFCNMCQIKLSRF